MHSSISDKAVIYAAEISLPFLSNKILLPASSAATFTVCAAVPVSVVFIAQASSEHSICFAVHESLAEDVLKALRESFAYAIEQGDIQSIRCDNEVAAIAAVGRDMTHQLGVLRTFSGSLARARVNIRAISQGATEKNICAIVASQDQERALRALHGGFYLSAKTIAVAVIGMGNVGATFIDQLFAMQQQLAQQEGVVIVVRAILNSKKMLLLDPTSQPKSQWREHFSNTSTAADLDQLIEHCGVDEYPHAVIVDCTADQGVAMRYVDFMRAGFHVITPNKKAGSGDYAYYQNAA